MNLHLSRLRLRRDPDVAALAHLLLPKTEGARVAAGHRLLWSLFADSPDRARDFLWCEDAGGTWQRATFLILSRRRPQDTRGLFEIETKPFAPVLAPGQRLGFRLRASPAASDTPTAVGRRGKRIDPVARALRDLPPEVRAERRHSVLQEVGAGWLARQGARAGFTLCDAEAPSGTRQPCLSVDGERWNVLPREGAAPVRFSSLDFEGVLRVEDPSLFLAALAEGFGRAKAFGCGLMLIRPNRG
ncbi:type I-E CRISPR-associated protein Cas6/Cse3/CasE [Methylobacterium nodulans]|uniref:CRISPR-associated protein, Cse3 family n=1 Tax=Methylobacterium nodulans (strain LMG 21967 / CNCM I-2342 / ORS 2060) TaxID=460265 RepID=B8IMR1_METNO|nr:type I-E CRISPR-associated protein Cas6/Cse3/CasE [Methylobacterium nodulans]ACL60254.1 CRISPR-associated protein, Cse3 family [Methylobacterium nodulans ORS 2060]